MNASEIVHQIRLEAERRIQEIDPCLYLSLGRNLSIGNGSLSMQIDKIYVDLGVQRDDSCRAFRSVTIRFAIIYYLRGMRKARWTAIGRAFNKHHSTIIYAVMSFDKWLQVQDGESRQIYDKILEMAHNNPSSDV